MKSRVGVAWAMTLRISMPIAGSFEARSLAVLAPNSLSSWTRMADLAGLPAFLLIASRAAMASLVKLLLAGKKRNTLARPRLVSASLMPLSMQKGCRRGRRPVSRRGRGRSNRRR